ncbi:hypothetical protein CDL15_Pgr017601 [Punica granatum]|uniref:Uncharacterized protein n=1 Tax=Punica granatum TaxID=22663 RepID=A0A218W665_PUNGR|nr:hypothetical protein CDL15_Pgr017601 [Punica granatum]PKI69434.1 hypothetical protein CRG98_010232 [Punica granatum]
MHSWVVERTPLTSRPRERFRQILGEQGKLAEPPGDEETSRVFGSEGTLPSLPGVKGGPCRASLSWRKLDRPQGLRKAR